MYKSIKFSVKLGLAGLVTLFVTLIVRYWIINKIITSDISEMIRLEPGSKIWDIWSDVPFPIYSKFYFFNVTNPDDIVNGQKPILKEVGPYVYEEHRMKVIINVNEESVKYRPRTHWLFRHEMSYGSTDDNITLVNIPFVGVSKLAWDLSKQPYVLSTLDELLVEKGERIFQTNKVNELLFDGVPIDNYMELLSLPVTEMFSDAKTKIPERILDGDFGFFDDRNGTAEDIWLVKTGKANLEEFGKVVSWNGNTKLEVWDDPKCNKISGTDGSIFPPFTSKSDTLEVFTPELCRSLQMKFSKMSTHSGLETMLFTFAPNTFGSLTEFPENECYCKDAYEHCQNGGLMPLAKCQGGAPLFLSHPHFMNANKIYREGVIGLDTLRNYESYLHLEKNTGMVIGATFRLQLNVELESYDSMTAFNNVPNVMIPVMWIEQSAIATDELLEPIMSLMKYIKAFDVISSVFIIISITLILAAILWEGKLSNWNIKQMFSSTILK